MIREKAKIARLAQHQNTDPLGQNGEVALRDRKSVSRRDVLLGVAGGAVACAASMSPAMASPSAKLIDNYWRRFGADAIGPDHLVWSQFLERYRIIDDAGVARIRYREVRASDRNALEGYLARMQSVRPTELSRDAAFAYWVNLYNAKVVSLVLEHKPKRSVREINSGWFGSGPWSMEVLHVEGRAMSLDTIKHSILRPVYSDPRTHYSLCDGTVGGPNIGERALAGDEIQQMLHWAARGFINDERGVRVDDDRLWLSSIYSWYAPEFGSSVPDLIEHLSSYAGPALRRRLVRRDRIDAYDYDWSLNAA